MLASRWNVAIAFSALLPSVFSQTGTADIYSLATTIPWVGKVPSSVDLSVVYNDVYYLADRTNAEIRVVSLLDYTQTGVITGFHTGYVNGTLTGDISGPDGLLVLPDRNELWAGDGDGTVKIISLKNNSIIASINTTAHKRADELAYDPTTGVVVVAAGSEDPPFVAVMSANSRTLLGKISFPGATGLEAPAFDAVDGVFFQSVPSTPYNPGGALCTLNINNLSIAATFPLPFCENAGIAVGPNQNLFVGCSSGQFTDSQGPAAPPAYAASYVIDRLTGAVIAKIFGISGIDQVVYDPTTNFYYAAAYQNQARNGTYIPSVAIVNASSNTLVQTIMTDNVTAHAVAVNPRNGQLIVPVKSKGIMVYSLVGAAAGSGNASATLTTTGAPIVYTGNAAGSGSASATLTITGAPAIFTGGAAKHMAASACFVLTLLAAISQLL